MSELKPSAYEFVSELPPPVFEGAPLPIREFQVRTVINDSLFMRSDSLPASLEPYFENGSVDDVVKSFEKSDEPTEVKNGRLLGLIAAMTEIGLDEFTTPRDWQLTAHLGMLNALAAALSAGLSMSEDSLRMAMAFHREYSGRNAATPDDLYASPGADSIVQALKRTMSGYGSMDFLTGEEGIERYVSYCLYDIDRMLFDLQLSPEVLASYREDVQTQHMADACNHIITQIEITRSAALDRRDELEEHLERVYARVIETQIAQDARFAARGVQETLPGLEDLNDPVFPSDAR